MANIATTPIWITLREAVEAGRKLWPALPVAAIRKALREEKISHLRSSNCKRARYYVRLSDFQAYITTLQANRK